MNWKSNMFFYVYFGLVSKNKSNEFGVFYLVEICITQNIKPIEKNKNKISLPQHKKNYFSATVQ